MSEDQHALLGGYGDDELYDGEFSGGYNNSQVTDGFFSGGVKDEDKSSYTVKEVSDGSFEGGYYISSSPGGAARKAATAIFRHIDIESGVRPQSKSSKRNHVPVSAALSKIYGKQNPIKEVSFVILRIDRNDLRKYFAYTAVREKLRGKVVPYKTVDARGRETVKEIKIDYKITVKRNELPEQYASENKRFKNTKVAKQRAVERATARANGEVVKRAPAKKTAKKTAAKKAPAKKAAAPKSEKKTKKSTAPTLADIIKSLSRSGDAKPAKKSAAKKPAAAKKAPAAKKAAAKKPAAKKTAKKTGGGYCSFF